MEKEEEPGESLVARIKYLDSTMLQLLEANLSKLSRPQMVYHDQKLGSISSIFIRHISPDELCQLAITDSRH